MVSEGDRSPPVAAAVKKEPPSATHGSLVVIEHGRTRKTAVRCRDPALETRTPSNAKITTRTPFSPKRMPKRSKGCHCTQGTERDLAQTTTSRQKPPAPEAPIPLERYRKSAPGGPGAANWVRPSPLPLCLVTPMSYVYIDPPPLARRPRGAADFPCLRQLPPPPLK